MRLGISLSTWTAGCLIPAVIGLVILTRAVAQTTVPSPTTQSAQIPTAELPKDSPIRKWFNDLADPDPYVRDQARIGLMGMSRDDLAGLRELIIKSQPLCPDQAVSLYDIVIQAYLAGEKYPAKGGGDSGPDGDRGPFFLGITWPLQIENDLRMGVTIDQRLPGFPSYRFLRQGDMILGIYMDPKSELPNTETHTIGMLTGAIQALPATQNIALDVLRDGERLRIPVKMAPRPLYADPDNIGSLTTFISERQQRADNYWNETFAPLLDVAQLDADAQ